MRLNKLLKAIGHNANGYEDVSIKGITDNSKMVKEGYLFIALKGERQDGYDFIQEAIAKGAKVILSHKDFIAPSGLVKILVENKRHIAGELASAYFENPSIYLNAIGITGTNGKTTTSYLIKNIVEEAGFKTGLIGTISHRIGDRIIPANNTTPGAIELQGYLAKMRENKIKFAIMEISSHALEQNRVINIGFSCAVFTNMTQDHLDYHRTLEDYFKAKAKLFSLLKENGKAVINVDDEYGRKLAQGLRGKSLSYAIKTPSDITVEIHNMDTNGSDFEVRFPGGRLDIHTKLIGMHNVYNILAAAGAGICFGIEKEYIKKGIESLGFVRGRLEEVSCGQAFKVFIDYAHTEDALKNILTILRYLTKGRLIAVFGCGGDRDRIKRPLMGKVASELADYVIITNDNPRSEDPALITDEITKGFPDSFKNFKVIPDRCIAIKEALIMAKSADTVVIAGKGHEAYQIFKDRLIHFDDREEVEKILLRRN